MSESNEIILEGDDIPSVEEMSEGDYVTLSPLASEAEALRENVRYEIVEVGDATTGLIARVLNDMSDSIWIVRKEISTYIRKTSAESPSETVNTSVVPERDYEAMFDEAVRGILENIPYVPFRSPKDVNLILKNAMTSRISDIYEEIHKEVPF